MSPAAHPALVLNADFRPLSYFPGSSVESVGNVWLR
jgi:hypothetical protein